METIWLWLAFILLIAFLLSLDLGILNRKIHAPGISESLGWTAFWISLALIFNVVIYFLYEHHVLGIGTGQFKMSGAAAAKTFFTGYVIEKALSLDNIFAIGMVFSFFGVARIYQHRVLFWGIFGAILMRGAMILVGVALIQMFHWVLYIFGILLLYSAVKMLSHKDEEIHPDQNPVVKFFQKIFPITSVFHEEKFLVKENNRWIFTPLILVLISVECSDVIFAIDSIPAIFAITQDPFIVFTSNIFAILGLRSLYFVMAAMIAKFRYLQISLSVILAYVGVKLLSIDVIHHYIDEDVMMIVSLGVILLSILIGIAASLYVNKTKKD